MIDFESLANQIFSVEKQGFDPYNESYFGRLEMSEEDDPTRQNVQNNQGLTTNNNMTYLDAWKMYGDEQAKATRAFQEANPDIDVKAILEEYSNKSDFSNAKLDEYSAELVRRYGDRYAKPEDVKRYSPDYYNIVGAIRKGDIDSGYNKTTDTRGTKERPTAEELFGFRNLLERRTWTEENPVYYKYLQ